jgi:hypothetical protein
MKRRKIWGYFAGYRWPVKGGTYWIFTSRRGDRTRWQFNSKDGKIKREGYCIPNGESVVTRSNDPGYPVSVAKTDDSVRPENG